MEITHHQERKVFIATDNGKKLGEMTYTLQGGTVNFNHTFVDPAARGLGVAGELVAAGAKFVGEAGYKAKASCSYADKVLKRSYPQLLE
ncbi:MAG: N-acetyltransferase [Turicibacter sp.]|nr:N-acetyltransferase [Turicibacter sp.]